MCCEDEMSKKESKVVEGETVRRFASGATYTPVSPTLSPDEKLQLKTLEATVLGSQLQFQRLSQEMSEQQKKLQGFVQELFLKYKVDGAEWQISLQTLEFVKKEG